MKKILRIADFFEKLENKNEENARDLADVYLLIGQIYQYNDNFQDSITWFTRAIVADDQYSVPYHSCAISYLKIGMPEKAIKCFEQEIIFAPGNYYSYLMLADLYNNEGMHELVEQTLIKLLDRDPDNIQCLHKLILFYERSNHAVDVELLRRHLLKPKDNFNRIEALIRSYHFCREKRFRDALDFLDFWYQKTSEVTILHLVKAHVYGELSLYTKKRQELAIFKEKNHGKEDLMLAKLNEFGQIFGDSAADRLTRRLILSIPGFKEVVLS
jgi:tetratricopeptide (TPR) repeat protein